MYTCLSCFAKIHAIFAEEIRSMKIADCVFCAPLHCFWIDTFLDRYFDTYVKTWTCKTKAIYMDIYHQENDKMFSLSVIWVN